MSIRKSALSVALPLSLFAVLAIAQSDPAAMMEALDADGNGSLSESEASANEMIIANWEVLDADANGEISAEELALLAQ